MQFSDAFFKKVENKTSVNKDTILSLASKLQQNSLKDENKYRDYEKGLPLIRKEKLNILNNFPIRNKLRYFCYSFFFI